MDIKYQEYFVAIVEEGSISKASKKLFISQPTLSQFLSKLEKQLDVQLITRGGGNSFSLTEAGNIYYEYCKKMLSLNEDLQARISELKQSSPMHFTIGNNVGSSPSGLMLNKIASGLASRYPNVKVSFLHGGVNLLHQMMAKGELDIAFSSFTDKDPRFDYMTFPPLEMAVVIPKSHPLYHIGSEEIGIGMPHMELKDFEKESFVVIMPNTSMRDMIDHYCRLHGIDLDIKIEGYDSSVVAAAVDSGLGLGIYPPDTVLNTGDVRYIGLEPPLYYNWGMFYNSSNYQTAYFRDFVKAAMRLAETGGLHQIKKEYTDGR